MAADVIQGRFVKTTPPAAHPVLQMVSAYGAANARMATAQFGTRKYDEAFRECDRLWEQIADALGVDSGDGSRDG